MAGILAVPIIHVQRHPWILGLKGGRGVLLFGKRDVRKPDHLLERLPLRGQPLWSLFAKLVEHVR